MSWGIVVVQLPVGCNVLSDPIDSSFESLELFHINLGIAGLDLADADMWHLEDCLFVLGSYSKIQDSSPVITLFKNWGSL